MLTVKFVSFHFENTSKMSSVYIKSKFTRHYLGVGKGRGAGGRLELTFASTAILFQSSAAAGCEYLEKDYTSIFQLSVCHL